MIYDQDPGIVDFEPDARDLIAELFPVEVSLPNGTVVSRAKVFVVVGGVVVYGSTPDRKSYLAFSARHAEHPKMANMAAPKRRQTSTFATTEGTVIAQGTVGCGCGSPLKVLTYYQVFGGSP